MHRVLAFVLLTGHLMGHLTAQKNWPQFLGPAHASCAAGARSLRFDTAKDLRYSVEIPAGASSPCLFGDRVFLTGKAENRFVMFALERKTGEELWRHTVAAAKPRKYLHSDGGVCMPTACTDGELVYFYFPEYGLIARKVDGEFVWEKKLGTPKTDFGIGSSPTLVDDKVILIRDGCPEAKIFALDKKTGKEVWSIPRQQYLESHSTPYVWRHHGRAELIIAGSGMVWSYDLKTGGIHWVVQGLTPLVCTTPVGDADRLYFAGWSTISAAAIERVTDGMQEQLELTETERTDPGALFDRLDKNGDGKLTEAEAPKGRVRDGFHHIDPNRDGVITKAEWTPLLLTPGAGKNLMIAIKPGGRGDISKTHVAWRTRRGIPYVASPLLYRGRLFLAKAGGVVGAFDPKTGKQVIRRQRLPDHAEYYATPVGVDGKILVGSAAGTLYVLDPEAKLKTLASVELGDTLQATPAIVDGVVYIRTRTRLFAFGK